MSDFILESKGHCFFCLEKVSPRVVGTDSLPELSTVHSLQYLSRFLGIDRRKIFPDIGNIPSHLLAKVEMSRLKVELCDGCASMNETFSKVCRRLQQIKIEVMSALEPIHRKLLTAERSSQNDGLRKLLSSMGGSGEEWDAKFDILEVLREDASRKCSTKLRKARPRIRMQNLTKKNIGKVLHKHKLNLRKQSRSNFIQTACEQYYQPDSFSNLSRSAASENDDTPATPILEEAMIKSEFELDDEFSDTGNSETAFPSHTPELHDVPKREQGNNRRSTEPGINSANDNIEVIQPTGKRSQFRCKLCEKEFFRRNETIRHIKIIHLKEKPHQCPICSKAFFLRHHLQGHMPSHSGRMPYKCHLCPKGFRQKHHLKEHLLAHTGVKPYKCGMCDKSYTQQGSLTRHQLSHQKKNENNRITI